MMPGADDLTEAVLSAQLGGRPLRWYPALLSTSAEAMAWARAGGPAGAVVLADYQVSPRGRGGRPWQVPPDSGLAFSMLLRPQLPADREGWLYTLAVLGLADVLADLLSDVGAGDCSIAWPEEVRHGGRLAGAVGIYVELGPGRVEWAVLDVFLPDAPAPRAALVARVAAAVEARERDPVETVLADYATRCATLGRTVQARMVPLGPNGPSVSGTALRTLADGALVLAAVAGGRPVAVLPQNLGILDDP